MLQISEELWQRLWAHAGCKKARWGVNAPLCSLPAQVKGAESGTVSEKEGLRATVLGNLPSRGLHSQYAQDSLKSLNSFLLTQFPS